MNIGIIDADFLAAGRHRFPNLAAMKLSGYHKNRGDHVQLLTSYERMERYDRTYVTCVFSKNAQRVPRHVLQLPNVQYGGTGFHYDKYDSAPVLRAEIEHATPDYTLYQPHLSGRKNTRYYTNFCVGFLTRGCFRRCTFCVMRNSRSVEIHSPLAEIIGTDPTSLTKNLCFLDDNILGLGIRPGRRPELIKLLEQINAHTEDHRTRYRLQQGMDIRIMRPEYAKLFSQARYYEDYIFAFDNLKEAEQVKRGLGMFRDHGVTRNIKCYLLCGFHGHDDADIATVFERLKILWRPEFRATGYVMRHDDHKQADEVTRTIYSNLARWCNQPAFQKKMTFREFCGVTGGKAVRTLRTFERRYPHMGRYLDMAHPNKTC